MGTRADFYIGRGTNAEWLGSIAWDGYPDSEALADIIGSKDDTAFRVLVDDELTNRDDGTKPDAGWPWPWDDSGTTDYAYAFDGGKVWASCFGSPWFDATEPQPEDDADYRGEAAVFPDMAGQKNLVRSGPRSGLMVISSDASGRMRVE